MLLRPYRPVAHLTITTMDNHIKSCRSCNGSAESPQCSACSSANHPVSCGKKRGPEEELPETSKLQRREIIDEHQNNYHSRDETISRPDLLQKIASLHRADRDVGASRSCSQGSCVHIDSLPLSVMLQIFSSLPPYDLLHRVAPVCKSWNQLAYDPSLWKTLNLRKYSKITDTQLLKVLGWSRRVLFLDISDLRNITRDGIPAALTKCGHLRTLKMHRSMHLHLGVFQSIAKSCQSLQQLFLDGSTSVCDKSLLLIASSCHKLELLRINQCSKVSDKGIIAVAKTCHKLRQITMDQCTKVTDASLKALVDNCPKLQAISCMSCDLTDVGVGYLSKAPDLQFMEVSNIKGLTNKCIMKVVGSCPKLECINVSLCTSINDECVDYIARHAKSLKSIYLVSCNLTDSALMSLGTHCKTIETVDVGWCKGITDAGVDHISRICPTLKYLGLMRCDRVSIPVTEELVEKYPGITYSSMWLDCRRLLERAKKEGAHLNIPFIGPPPLQQQ